MAKYICEECKHNNNGWCNIKKMNGLKKLNLQSCDERKQPGAEVLLEKEVKGELGIEYVTVTINGQVASFPEHILRDFLEQEAIVNLSFIIPE